MFLYMLFIL